MSDFARPLTRGLLAEALGTAILVATVVGSGIMAERLAGSNQAIALLGNTCSRANVPGALGGGAGGYLLESVVTPTVTATGDPVIDDSAVNEWFVRVFVALIVGGMLNLIVGFVKSEMTKNRPK